MKHSIYHIILGFILLSGLAACTGGAQKFTGKWKAIKSGSNKIIVIEKKGDNYDFYPQDEPESFMSFTYDKDHDILTSNQDRTPIDIRYEKETKHLIAGPRAGGGWGETTMELERVE